MGATYTIDPEKKRAIVRLFGEVTASDVAEVITAIRNDPLWSSSFDRLWDCRDAIALRVHQDALRIISQYADMPEYRSRRSAVLISKSSALDFSRFYDSMVRKWHVMAFTDEEQAIRWLSDGNPSRR